MLLISSSCTCILKRSIIMDNSINFNNDFLQGEDGLFILKYLSYTRKIYVMEVILYQYNRYALSDRVSITSCITKDVYILFIKYFKELIKIIEPSLNENEKKKLSQNFFDRLIPSLITLVIYSETSSKEIIKELKNIINIDVVQQASKKYKRHNRKHSIFIPLFIRAKLPKLLYYTLNVRVKRHQKLYGKSKYVNSIFWNKNGGIEVV